MVLIVFNLEKHDFQMYQSKIYSSEISTECPKVQMYWYFFFLKGYCNFQTLQLKSKKKKKATSFPYNFILYSDLFSRNDTAIASKI